MTTNFVPARVPLVDPRTGLITREWYLLFTSIFAGSGIPDDQIDIVGPSSGNSDLVSHELGVLRDEFSLSPAPFPVVAALDDLSPPQQQMFFAADDVIPVINALRDEIAMLRRRIDEIAQGSPVL